MERLKEVIGSARGTLCVALAPLHAGRHSLAPLLYAFSLQSGALTSS